MPREIRVTVEVLDANGKTTHSEVVLTEANGSELADGAMGDIETAIDGLLETVTADDDDEVAS